jgi:hypothetical protein
MMLSMYKVSLLKIEALTGVVTTASVVRVASMLMVHLVVYTSGGSPTLLSHPTQNVYGILN